MRAMRLSITEIANLSLWCRKILTLPPSNLFPVRPGVTLLFVFLSSEGFDAKALRALVADGAFRRLTAEIANVVCVFGPWAGSRGDYVHALCLLSNLVRRLTDVSHS